MKSNSFSTIYFLSALPFRKSARYYQLKHFASMINPTLKESEPARFGLESQVKRNPHPDFKAVEKSREPFNKETSWKYTQTVDTKWVPGSGANDNEWAKHKKVELDPNAETRNPIDNYKLLTAAISPRPIGFISTISTEGARNLAPFSYFTIVSHDPPIFVVGLSGGRGNPKDTCKNVLETKELTINIISEWFIDAANFTATNSPHGIDEWKLSGLTPLPSTIVKPEHVAESAFSVEAKLVHSHEWHSKKNPDRATGTTLIVEGVNFHIREDVTNKGLNNVDIAKLKPVARLGGITYGRIIEGFELPRPDFDKEIQGNEEVRKLIE